MDINRKIAQAYLQMQEGWKKGKMKKEAWVPESIADEDVADFMGAAAAAAKAGKKEFKFGDKTYKVTMKKSTANAIEDAVEICEKCGKVHEGSCNEEVQEKALSEDLEENNSDKYMWKDINAALMKAGMNPPQIMKVLSGLKGKAIKEEALEESPEQPRAKGEKDFKKMHDDNTEIVDEKDGEEETFDNIKKSADAVKK